MASLVAQSVCNVEHLGSIPGLGRSPGEGNGNPLQNSCLENSMDRGAWWCHKELDTTEWFTVTLKNHRIEITKDSVLTLTKQSKNKKALSNSERIIRKWKLLPWERKCLSRISRGPSAMNSVAMILILHGRRNKVTSTVFLWFCYVMLL